MRCIDMTNICVSIYRCIYVCVGAEVGGRGARTEGDSGRSGARGAGQGRGQTAKRRIRWRVPEFQCAWACGLGGFCLDMRIGMYARTLSVFGYKGTCACTQAYTHFFRSYGYSNLKSGNTSDTDTPIQTCVQPQHCLQRVWSPEHLHCFSNPQCPG